MINKPVDIIIPIYNAADDLEICLESIYKNTDLSRNRLVLINDNSPDPRIKEILDAQNDIENVVVIHNEKNQGFSANINLGMAQSDENDVILLNSDTVVTERWVEKMVECAYSTPEIGTVTPLSNNATLCSVPVFCEENKLPDNIDAEKMGKIVEHCSMRKYPRISVAHGFCMLVKREVINAVGNFDAETFGRGYGEENDFCNRAEQLGYIHVQCDDTFILHTGTKSFVSSEKQAYIREHEAILRVRYPSQMHANDVYVRDNPNGYVQENVRIFMDIENGKENILYVTHSDFRKDASDNVGGTQLHVKHLKDEMLEKYNVFVAARDGEYLNLTLYTGNKEHFWKFNIGEYKGFFRFHDGQIRKVWNLIFDAFNIDIIHVHHVHSLSFDIFDIAEEREIPVLLTCHDYFFVSPALKMLDENYRIIERNEMNEAKWRAALSFWAGIYEKTNYISAWQRKCGDVLSKCKEIFVPDVTVKQYLTAYYPEIDKKVTVVPHGYEFKKLEEYPIVEDESVGYYVERVQKNRFGDVIEGWVSLNEQELPIEKVYLHIEINGKEYRIPTSISTRADVVNEFGTFGKAFRTLIPSHIVSEDACVGIIASSNNISYKVDNICEIKNSNSKSKSNLKVGFIGGINKEKGGSVICKLIEQAPMDIDFYIFGNIGCQELNDLERKNLYKFDKYDSNDLPSILDIYEIDLVCVLSIWPETFSYTLSESILCGVPVIVTDTGALGERMKQFNAGWMVSLDNAQEEILDIIISLKTNNSALEEKKSIARGLKLITLSEMAQVYDIKYSEIINDRPRVYKEFNSEELYKNYMQRSYGVDSAENIEIISNGISDEDKAVLNSLSFRMVKHIRKVNFPFKKQIWAVLRNRY